MSLWVQLCIELAVREQILFIFFKIFHLVLFCVLTFTRLYVNAPCVCSAQGGQKRASDPLELELQMAMSHHEGGGN